MSTLCNVFRHSAERYPNHVLVHHLTRNWTYEEIGSRAAAIAEWFSEHGLKRGDRVGLLLPNSPEYVAAYFGVLFAGGSVVGLNPDTTPQMVANTLGHCDAAAVVVASACEKHLAAVSTDALEALKLVLRVKVSDAPAPLAGRVTEFLPNVWERPANGLRLPEAESNDVAQIIYTSGTTGHPKGVTLSHRNLTANAASIVDYLSLTSADSVFAILPFFYSYGNSLLLTHVAVGGRLILASDFVFWNRAMDLMEAERATGFSGVPSSYAMMLHKSNFAQRKFQHMRYFTCAGGGLAPAVVRRLREIIPQVQIFLMYGQTEASARLSTLMPEDIDRKPGSIGKGIPGVELSVVDNDGRPVRVGEVGEIVAKGDNIMVGYWNDPEETAEVVKSDGLHTSDLARVDEDGYIFIVGRSSDMIKSGAYRINPKEIEEVMLEIAEIAEVAVVGLPDDILGEVMAAFVVRSPNQTVTEKQIIHHCREKLPRYKLVKSIHFVEALPKTSSGKVRRFALRDAFLEGSLASK